jgi:hypothetical protein
VNVTGASHIAPTNSAASTAAASILLVEAIASEFVGCCVCVAAAVRERAV